eukprot:1506708-Prymnesium_polylepis.1
MPWARAAVCRSRHLSIAHVSGTPGPTCIDIPPIPFPNVPPIPVTRYRYRYTAYSALIPHTGTARVPRECSSFALEP